MQFDDIYKIIGHVGHFQLVALFGICCLSFFDSEPSTMNFVGGSMDHFCKIDRLANLSYDQQREIAIPWNQVLQKFEQCSMFDVDFSNYTDEQLVNWNRTRFLENEGRSVVKSCLQWNYVQDTYTSTIVSRYNLICDGRRHLPAFVSTLYMIGGLFGAFLAGALSDRFGRKPAIVSFLSLRIIGAAMFTFAPNYELFAVGRFILGIGGSGNRIVTYALAAEMIGPKFRTICMGIVQSALSIGVVVSAVMGHFIRDDFHYQIAYFSPYLFVLILCLTVVPESPRWLFAKGRYDQLNNLLRLIARVNRKKLPDGFDSRKIERKDSGVGTSKANALTLFSHPILRTRTIVILFGWFAASFIYYSILLNAGALPGNVFLNTGIIGAVGLPSLVLGMFLSRVRLLGRRITAALGLLFVGLFYFITIPIIVFDGAKVGTTALSFMSKFSLTIYAIVLVVYTSELYPTEVRNVALGLSLTSSRISSTIAPYMGRSLAEVWKPLPSIIIGVLATAIGVSFFFLPETLGQPICDTLQEVENQRAEGKKDEAMKSNNNSSNSRKISKISIDGPNTRERNISQVVICINGIPLSDGNDDEDLSSCTNEDPAKNSSLDSDANLSKRTNLGASLPDNTNSSTNLSNPAGNGKSLSRSSSFLGDDPVDKRVRRFSGLGTFNAGFLLDELTYL